MGEKSELLLAKDDQTPALLLTELGGLRFGETV
jgi:hypothetical protein